MSSLAYKPIEVGEVWKTTCECWVWPPASVWDRNSTTIPTETQFVITKIIGDDIDRGRVIQINVWGQIYEVWDRHLYAVKIPENVPEIGSGPEQ